MRTPRVYVYCYVYFRATSHAHPYSFNTENQTQSDVHSGPPQEVWVSPREACPAPTMSELGRHRASAHMQLVIPWRRRQGCVFLMPSGLRRAQTAGCKEIYSLLTNAQCVG